MIQGRPHESASTTADNQTCSHDGGHGDMQPIAVSSTLSPAGRAHSAVSAAGRAHSAVSAAGRAASAVSTAGAFPFRSGSTTTEEGPAAGPGPEPAPYQVRAVRGQRKRLRERLRYATLPSEMDAGR